MLPVSQSEWNPQVGSAAPTYKTGGHKKGIIDAQKQPDYTYSAFVRILLVFLLSSRLH